MKHCLVCDKKKPLDEFHRNKHKKDGRQTRCKECKKKSDAEYFQKNKQKIIDGRKANREHHKAVRYGMTVEELHRIQQKFDGRCWVCLVRQGTDVDHCHVSLNVRGWLCGQCNRAIGLLRDNAETLRRAANYLDGQLGLLEAPPDSESGA